MSEPIETLPEGSRSETEGNRNPIKAAVDGLAAISRYADEISDRELQRLILETLASIQRNRETLPESAAGAEGIKVQIENIKTIIDEWHRELVIECRGDEDCDHCVLMMHLYEIERLANRETLSSGSAEAELGKIKPSTYYRGDGDHSVRDLEKLVKERDEEIYQLRLLAQKLVSSETTPERARSATEGGMSWEQIEKLLLKAFAVAIRVDDAGGWTTGHCILQEFKALLERSSPNASGLNLIADHSAAQSAKSEMKWVLADEVYREDRLRDRIRELEGRQLAKEVRNLSDALAEQIEMTAKAQERIRELEQEVNRLTLEKDKSAQDHVRRIAELEAQLKNEQENNLHVEKGQRIVCDGLRKRCKERAAERAGHLALIEGLQAEVERLKGQIK